MVAYSCSAGADRIVAGQQDVIWLPRNGARGRRLVVLLHGQLQSALDWNSDLAPNQQSIGRAIAGAGFPVVSIYADGPGWGNDAVVADLEATRTFASTIGCATDKLILVGASMGALDMLNYARAYPARAAALIGIMPACDIDDCRDNNRAGSAQANINTAWGMPGGSTSGTNPLPARANPSADANAALIKQAIDAGAPAKLYYSTADTVAVPATVAALAAKLGIAATAISGALDHGDALFGSVPTTELLTVIAAAA